MRRSESRSREQPPTITDSNKGVADPKAAPADAQSKLHEFAKDTLQKIQKLSIEENIEYCGYIVLTAEGTLKILGPNRGTIVGCRTPLVYKPDVILASFHTHGAFDPRVLTEIPSALDFDAVAMERVAAYIGTPGGRFWRLDVESGTARLLCGGPKVKDCLLRQHSFPKGLDYQVPAALTRLQVLEIEQKSSTPASLRR